jgi:hypothetical protein
MEGATMHNEEITEKLFSKKSADRRRAAKEIGKNKLKDFGHAVYKQYLEEKKDKRTWETQCEMIKALGHIDYKNALKEIDEIVRNNIPHDMVTFCAAAAYVRLHRENTNDGKPVLELLEFGGISVIGGALFALAFDQMMPDNATIEKIIEKCWDLQKHKDRIGEEHGTMDYRKYLALACANWDKELTEGFLNHCIETSTHINRLHNTEVKDSNLIDVCQNSLKGKYSKSYISY